MTTLHNGMRPIHPGEVLREGFLKPLNINSHALAMSLQVPATRIGDIIHERRALTTDTALRLAKYFGTSAEFWTGLQTDYETAITRKKIESTLQKITPITQTA